VLGSGAATTVVAASRIVQTLGDALWAAAAAVLLRGVARRAVPAPDDLPTDGGPREPASSPGGGPARRPA